MKEKENDIYIYLEREREEGHGEFFICCLTPQMSAKTASVGQAEARNPLIWVGLVIVRDQ